MGEWNAKGDKKRTVTVKTITSRFGQGPRSNLEIVDENDNSHLIERWQINCSNEEWQQIKPGTKIQACIKETIVSCRIIRPGLKGEKLIFSDAPYKLECPHCNIWADINCEIEDDAASIIRKALNIHAESAKPDCEGDGLRIYMLVGGCLVEQKTLNDLFSRELVRSRS